MNLFFEFAILRSVLSVRYKHFKYAIDKLLKYTLSNKDMIPLSVSKLQKLMLRSSIIFFLFDKICKHLSFIFVEDKFNYTIFSIQIFVINISKSLLLNFQQASKDSYVRFSKLTAISSI